MLTSYLSTLFATMINSLLVFRAIKGDSVFSLNDIAILFNKCSRELWQDYIYNRNFTRLYKVLLKIAYKKVTLKEYFFSLIKAGALIDVINKVNSCGRTALV